MSNIYVAGRFLLGEEIASGSFGTVYKGKNIFTHEDVAIKVEHGGANKTRLQGEADIYAILSSGVGIPTLHAFHKGDQYSAMVVDRVGHDLQYLRAACGGRFSLKTVLLLASPLISVIEYIHSRGIIHGDIKPENMAISREEHCNQVYVFDFGHAKLYRDPQTGVLLESQQSTKQIGTARYASINAHNGILDWANDLASLAYVFFYFFDALPWTHVAMDDQEEEDELMLNLKREMTNEDLCDFPPEFSTFLNYTNSLPYAEKPSYDYCRGLFDKALEERGFRRDHEYDWHIIRREKEVEEAVTHGKYELLTSEIETTSCRATSLHLGSSQGQPLLCNLRARRSNTGH